MLAECLRAAYGRGVAVPILIACDNVRVTESGSSVEVLAKLVEMRRCKRMSE